MMIPSVRGERKYSLLIEEDPIVYELCLSMSHHGYLTRKYIWMTITLKNGIQIKDGSHRIVAAYLRNMLAIPVFIDRRIHG